MAIYDCFQYFDEDHILELRLNILDKYVDYFVISESTKTHQGRSKKINFDINKFKKFEHKIKFIVADYKKKIDFKNHTGGESPVEQHQRNYLMEGVKNALPDDFIILSDSDEIPDFTKIKSFSHGEFNKEGLNEKNIEEKILRNKDIFERKNKLKKVTIDNSYPDYIINNKEKLSNWII